MTRRAYKRLTVAEEYGVSIREVDRAIARGDIRTRRVGRRVLLHPGDVEKCFGFPSESAEIQPSAESVAEIEDLLA